MTNTLVVNFREYLESRLEYGQNGHGQTAQYVSRSCLKAYWTEGHVRRLLDSCDSTHAGNEKEIVERFLLVFSTLTYIGMPLDIDLFISKNKDDHHLPFENFPQPWPPNLSPFLKEQWMFCPLEFTAGKIWKRQLPASQIMPVTFEDLVNDRVGGAAARVKKVRLHSGCNFLNLKDDFVVFKVYQGDDGEHLYQAESNLYLRLLKSKDNSITSFYGCFSYEETKKRIIILEFAASGSLLDFFQGTGLPALPDEFKMLWENLLGLLDALHTLRNLNGNRTSDRPVVAVHLDIQPANILVFPKSRKSPYDVNFKLADFGLAVMQSGCAEDVVAIDNEGNRMYSAPECYPNHPIQDRVKMNVDAGADLWALGAVYSDVLAWSILGEPGRDDYRQKRKKAISQLSHLKASGFDACFHDGTDNRLGAVDDFHAHLLDNTRKLDVVSSCMSAAILTDMLTSHKKRLPPAYAKTHAEDRIQTALQNSIGESSTAPTIIPHQDPSRGSSLRHSRHSEFTRRVQSPTYPILTNPVRRALSPQDLNSQPQFPFTADLHESPTEETTEVFPERLDNEARPVTSQRSGPSTTSAWIVTVGKVYEMLERKRSSNIAKLGHVFDKWQDKQTPVMELPGVQEARSKISAREGRDQIMLIDNFSSMSSHRDAVAKTARAISYVTKVADKDGMDLYLASNTSTATKCVSSTVLESKIRKVRTVDGMCNLRNCLDDILKPVFQHPIKPTSLYVYTDGVWEPGIPEVHLVIKDSIERLVKAGKPPTTLMFQFIQFGDDAEGTERLRYLDDECRETHTLGTYDIVDTKHYSDNVPDIIIGSISGFNDNKRTSTPAQRQQ